jgi:hypothetical protein
MNMKRYWLSTVKMTVGVTTDASGIVVEAAPIVRKFIGQPLDNLVRWLSKQQGFQVQEL